MNDQWAEVTAAIRSGDPGGVNPEIDRIEDLDADERARLFDVGFDELAGIDAESDDGYLRYRRFG